MKIADPYELRFIRDEEAQNVEVDAGEVAEHLDYRRLAVALLEAVRSGI